MHRRNFLKIAGSTAVIVAAGGAGFVATRTPTAALKPWKTAGSVYPDPLRRALSYAILAPNPHNRQPWIIGLKGETEAVVTCDLERLLPQTDPFGRQIVIGLGCFLELFSIAASDQGFRAEIRYFPEGQPDQMLDRRPIAHLSLSKQPGLVADPLFVHTLSRHTNRTPYDTDRAVGDDLLRRLRDAPAGSPHIGTANRGTLLQDLRNLTAGAMLAEMQNPEANRESIDLMRIGRAEIETNPDGISLGGAFLEALSMAGVLTRKSLADPASRSYRIALDMIEEAAMATMGFVWINTIGNDRAAQIDAGRAYLRVALQATADQLAMQPMSQALQEYAAMAPYFQTLHDRLTSRPGERVQMLARLGYANQVGPAPRWPLKTRLRES
ncbi:MAG TPA: twin-arginine translocation pathway signal protein [Thermohalobaculum sp.]|nr:twin-arginine translocation pathway signal protein [Thermohalobaculum sp.]